MSQFFRVRNTRRLIVLMMIAPWLHSVYAAQCAPNEKVHIKGDVPGAISYDIFSHLYPLNVQRLARLTEAGQVKLLPNNTLVCVLPDDGVLDPSALLVGLPDGQMNYWVAGSNVSRD